MIQPNDERSKSMGFFVCLNAVDEMSGCWPNRVHTVIIA